MNKRELSRIDRFRQFKSQIRGSASHLIVGIDIAKSKHHAFFGSPNGHTVLKGLIVENSASGFEHLLTQVQFYMDRDGFKEVAFGVEPTGVYHKPLSEFLIENDHLVVYVTNEAIKKAVVATETAVAGFTLTPTPETINLHLQISDGQQPLEGLVHLYWPGREEEFESELTTEITLPLLSGEPVVLTVSVTGYQDTVQTITPTNSLDLVVSMIKEQ